MSKILAYTKDMPPQEWHKWRMKGIGGSDAPTVCGFNPYKSIIELWLEKTGQANPQDAGEAAYWGKVMEPIIIKEFQNRTGIQVGQELTVMQHEKYPFMIANIDGIAVHPQTKEPCLFEAKTASSYRSHLWDDDIPEEYMIQDLQHVQKSHYRFLNSVADFCDHSQPLRRTASFQEHLFSRTIDGNPLLLKAQEILNAL